MKATGRSFIDPHTHTRGAMIVPQHSRKLHIVWLKGALEFSIMTDKSPLVCGARDENKIKTNIVEKFEAVLQRVCCPCWVSNERLYKRCYLPPSLSPLYITCSGSYMTSTFLTLFVTHTLSPCANCSSESHPEKVHCESLQMTCSPGVQVLVHKNATSGTRCKLMAVCYLLLRFPRP